MHRSLRRCKGQQACQPTLAITPTSRQAATEKSLQDELVEMHLRANHYKQYTTSVTGREIGSTLLPTLSSPP